MNTGVKFLPIGLNDPPKKYQMFYDNRNRASYLVVDENGLYHYPELNKVIEITYLLRKDPEISEIRDDKIKKFSFTPKVKYAGLITLLSVSFLTGCANNDKYLLPSQGGVDHSRNEQTVDYSNMPNISEQEFAEKYLSLIAPADDDYDFRYANDYEVNDFVYKQYGRDSSTYEQIFGYSHPTEEMLYEALDCNSSIPQRYKDFIREYIHDWLTLWPDSDLTPLYYNLPTLQIEELTQAEMRNASLSLSVPAQYLRSENKIMVLDTIELNRESDDYIIFAHELTHCARMVRDKTQGNQIEVAFYIDNDCGSYADEAIVTNLVYEMQGLGQKSNKYTLQSSYFRIIMDGIGYDGADYMNHSVNYLMDMMNEYMGDDYAYHIIPLIDAQGSLHYTDYMDVDFYQFDELYRYITRMYCQKYLIEGMTSDEAQNVYDNLINEVTYFFDQMARPYDLNMETFEDEFVNCCNEKGIEYTKGKGL